MFYSGVWGTACDTYFHAVDAKVACKQLGLPYSNAQVVHDAAFGEGSGTIFNHIDCTGSEIRLDESDGGYSWFHTHCSTHLNDAGVRCL